MYPRSGLSLLAVVALCAGAALAQNVTVAPANATMATMAPAAANITGTWTPTNASWTPTNASWVPLNNASATMYWTSAAPTTAASTRYPWTTANTNGTGVSPWWPPHHVLSHCNDKTGVTEWTSCAQGLIIILIVGGVLVTLTLGVLIWLIMGYLYWDSLGMSASSSTTNGRRRKKGGAVNQAYQDDETILYQKDASKIV